MLLFLSSSEISLVQLHSVVFNNSSSYANTNLPIRRFFNKQFIVSKHSYQFYRLYYTQSHMLEFQVKYFLQVPKLSLYTQILYTHTSIHHNSIFALN